jgi:hypothetical protein
MIINHDKRGCQGKFIGKLKNFLNTFEGCQKRVWQAKDIIF